MDLDDTLIDLLNPWVVALNEKYGTNIQKEDIVEWNMQKAFPSLNKSEIYSPLKERSFWDGVEPIEGAIGYLILLMKEGHEILIVTASHYSVIEMKAETVLKRYFSFIPWEDVIITSDKRRIRGDVLVDDAPHNLIGGKYRRILFDAPYNRGFNEGRLKMRRVKNWKEAYQAIQEIAGENKKGAINACN